MERDIYVGDISLSEAKTLVKRELAKGEAKNINVYLPKGVYSPEDFVFGEDDCSETCRVSYIGEAGAVIDGGVTVSSEKWQKPFGGIAERFRSEVADKIFMVDLAQFGYDRSSWGGIQAVGGFKSSGKYPNREKGVNCQVFCGNERMDLARYPNEGYLKIDEVMDVGQVSEFPPQNYFKDWAKIENPRGGCYIMDVETAKRVATWKTEKDIWLFGYLYWDWADSSTPVKLCAENRQINPDFVSVYGCRKGANYYFYNVPEELDSAGEWYLDRDSAKLYFYPENENTISFTCREAPLISCKGTVNMAFEGMTLQNTTGAAVVCDGEGMFFSKLNVQNIGGNGIECKGRNNLIQDCDIARLGEGGVVLSGGEKADLTHGSNRVTGCRIYDFAQIYKTYRAGVSILGVGNICDGNEIFRTPHMAIYYNGNEHLIENNNIHECVTDSQDAGAIYGGRDWLAHGTIIRNNRLENIGSEEFKPAGIYWDDGLTGQTAYGNVLINVGGQGFLVGGGRENIVCANVLINCGCPIHFDDRNRDGFVHGGWAKHAVNTTEGFMWKSLEAVDYTKGIWAERYPRLLTLKSFHDDPDHIDHPVNPSYSVVKGNVIIDGKCSLGYIADSVRVYSEIGENPVYLTADEAGWNGKKLESGSNASKLIEKTLAELQ
ncbi:MAG: right-handed parallel beta-helix repeat-containing protein [Clostridia bacterium]|nr:right-handed parallel beta-helix repeat-containing protein [Clostridia bacterium]